jgi:hypothetical protein
MPDKPTVIHARCDRRLREDLDDWRRQQANIPPRSQAICELLRRALLAEARRQSKGHAAA